MDNVYMPFKDKEECLNEMLKHQPFGWVKHCDGHYLNLTVINDYGIKNISPEIDDTIIDHTFSFDYGFDIYTFIDGTPFGHKITT